MSDGSSIRTCMLRVLLSVATLDHRGDLVYSQTPSSYEFPTVFITNPIVDSAIRNEKQRGGGRKVEKIREFAMATKEDQ